MKVSNNSNKEALDVGGLSRSKKSDRANAAKNQEAANANAGTGINGAAAVEISGEAKALSQANKIARSENSDQAKIDRIKAMINDGSYKPDYGKVAERLVNEQVMQELA